MNLLFTRLVHLFNSHQYYISLQQSYVYNVQLQTSRSRPAHRHNVDQTPGFEYDSCHYGILLLGGCCMDDHGMRLLCHLFSRSGVVLRKDKTRRCALLNIPIVHYRSIMNNAEYQMLKFDWSICVTCACIIRESGIMAHKLLQYKLYILQKELCRYM